MSAFALHCGCGRMAWLFTDITIDEARTRAARSGWSTALAKGDGQHDVIDLCPTCTQEGTT